VSTTRTVIETPSVPRLGPYSQAIRAGDLIFVSGQAGLDPHTGAAAGESFAQQTRQAFENLRAVLDDAGSSMARVVKVTCFISDASGFPILNSLFAEYFPHAPPVRSAPVVALPRGLLFSIEAIALAGD
jgi:2-iminobutanoate/2-iminopropanoate deaminase